MPRRARLLLPLLLLVLLGCSSAEPKAALGEPLGDAGAQTPPPDAGDRPSPEPPCEDVALPLLTEETDGHLSRLYVEAELDAKRVALLFDTGSATTFLEQPAGTPDPKRHAGDILLGTCSVGVDGRPYPIDERIGGLDVVGTLGADVLLAGPAAELDLAQARLVRRVSLPLAAEITSWPTVRVDIVRGHLLAHVVVAGEPLRLLVNTGSPHVLWVGKSGEPGDQEVGTTDANGDVLRLYLGRADVKLGDGVSANVPILRAPSFPYFEGTVRALGGNIQGLLGLSALGRRRIIVDRDASRLRVQP